MLPLPSLLSLRLGKLLALLQDMHLSADIPASYLVISMHRNIQLYPGLTMLKPLSSLMNSTPLSRLSMWFAFSFLPPSSLVLRTSYSLLCPHLSPLIRLELRHVRWSDLPRPRTPPSLRRVSQLRISDDRYIHIYVYIAPLSMSQPFLSVPPLVLISS